MPDRSAPHAPRRVAGAAPGAGPDAAPDAAPGSAPGAAPAAAPAASAPPVFASIDVGERTVRYEFGDALRATGLVGRGMTLDYGDAAGDLRAAPAHVTTVPGLLNLVPVIWYARLRLSVPFSDPALEASLARIHEHFHAMYPDEPWDGAIAFEGPEVPAAEPGAATATLFSGGLDSVASVAWQLQDGDRPVLITVGGADMASDDDTSWTAVQRDVRAFAEELGLSAAFVRGDLKECLNNVRLSNIPSLAPYGISFWAGAQHGLALCGLTAPIVWRHGVGRLTLSASYTRDFAIPWGSSPEVDGQLRWSGFEVQHRGFDRSRQRKMADVAAFFAARGERRPKLRVCVSPFGDRSKNCGHCEKCLRTMAGLLATGEDPSAWGFDARPDEAVARIRGAFDGRRVLMKDDEEFMWSDVRDHALASPDADSALVAWLRDFEPSRYRAASKGRERFVAWAKSTLSRVPWLYRLVKGVVLRRSHRSPD